MRPLSIGLIYSHKLDINTCKIMYVVLDFCISYFKILNFKI